MRAYVLKILPPIWFLLFLAAGLTAHYFFPITRVFNIWIPTWSLIIGALVVIAGFALSNYASSIFAREKTEILPTSPSNKALVTEGPFMYSRNPMYLGMVVGLLGAAFALGTLPMFIAALADFLILNFFFIPFEEEKMERQFGDAYREYKNKVR